MLIKILDFFLKEIAGKIINKLLHYTVNNNPLNCNLLAILNPVVHLLFMYLAQGCSELLLPRSPTFYIFTIQLLYN